MKTIRSAHDRVNTVGVKQHTMEVAAAKPAAKAKPKRVASAPVPIPAGGKLISGPVAKRGQMPSARAKKPVAIGFDRNKVKALAGKAAVARDYFKKHEDEHAKHSATVADLKEKGDKSVEGKKALRSATGKMNFHAMAVHPSNVNAQKHKQALDDHAVVKKAMKTNNQIVVGEKSANNGIRGSKSRYDLRQAARATADKREPSPYSAVSYAKAVVNKTKRAQSFAIKGAEAAHGAASKAHDEASRAHEKHLKSHGKLSIKHAKVEKELGNLKVLKPSQKKKLEESKKALAGSTKTLKTLEKTRNKTRAVAGKTGKALESANAPIQAAKDAVRVAHRKQNLAGYASADRGRNAEQLKRTVSDARGTPELRKALNQKITYEATRAERDKRHAKAGARNTR